MSLAPHREPDRALDTLAQRLITAAAEVHRHLGPGYGESIYEAALCHELTVRGIPFARQVSILVRYKGELVGNARLDLVVDGRLVVELKAVESLAAVHTAQVVSYLRVTDLQLGILINFNVSVLRTGIRRVVHFSSSDGEKR